MPTSDQDAWVTTVLGIDPGRMDAAPAGTAGEGGGAGAGDAAAPAGLQKQQAAMAKLSQIWQLTETKVRGQVDALKSKLDELYAGDPGAAQMEKDFQVHIDTIFSKFDGSLAKDAAQAAATRSEEDLRKVKADLSKTITDYMGFLEHDSLALMDENPFVDLNIVATCESTLKQMLTALA